MTNAGYFLLLLAGVVVLYRVGRSYHIELQRRSGRIDGELTVKLLGLLTLSNLRLENIALEKVLYREARRGLRERMLASEKPVPSARLPHSEGSRRALFARIRAFTVTPTADRITASYSINLFSAYAQSVLFSLPLLLGGTLGLLADSGAGLTSAPEAKQHTAKAAPRSSEKVSPSYPDSFPVDAFKPDFCRLTQISGNYEGWGDYGAWGEMSLPIMQAGDRVHAFMRRTAWEPDGVIKQADAASLHYTNGTLDLSYTFVLKTDEPNLCLIDWQPVDYNERMRERYGAAHGYSE